MVASDTPPQPTTNGRSQPSSRAAELEGLLEAVTKRLVDFVQAADHEVQSHQRRQKVNKSCLVDYHSAHDLSQLLSTRITFLSAGRGVDGLTSTLDSILQYSVNTSVPGFLDKLYSAPLPPGIAAELILAVLNTNVHVYQVSPVLTLIEKYVTKALARLFGLDGPRSGGVSVQGGSASNTTSIVIARNTLYPQTKMHGNNADGLKLVLFTSAHGHYSIEKAAQQCGFGSSAVISVPVDPISGAMLPVELRKLIRQAVSQGRTPFYVNATAGTTVLGSFDPFTEIAGIAKEHNMWMHIDGAWGGSFAFSPKLSATRLHGCDLADSIAINPHKMMGVPVTCSFLLGKDLKQFHDANTLKAGYLFHESEDEPSHNESNGQHLNGDSADEAWQEPDDLADMTLQCGRRGDSLKLFMSWQYYGSEGYRERIESAYDTACYFADLVAKSPNLRLVSTNPPPCLQVCFHYAPNGRMAFEREPYYDAHADVEKLGKQNSTLTARITKSLVQRGFMIDFAPALEGQQAHGSFFRAVVNISTPRETVARLVDEIHDLGEEVCRQMRGH